MSGVMGRWTGTDAPFADQHAGDPQSWNLYGYVRNNPLMDVDLNGRKTGVLPLGGGKFAIPRPENAGAKDDMRIRAPWLIYWK